jgi:predicted CopG family antitoxin
MRRVPFSNKNVDIADLALHHYDVENSLRNYFSTNANSFTARFTCCSASELTAELQTRLAELDMTSSLTILSAVEAVFRIDYLQRCYQKEKDSLSRTFRALHKRKTSRVDLENEIFDIWKQHTNGAAKLISELKGAFKYRHWLAHGRYWEPKLGREYDFVSLYTLATSVLANFPLLGP